MENSKLLFYLFISSCKHAAKLLLSCPIIINCVSYIYDLPVLTSAELKFAANTIDIIHRAWLNVAIYEQIKWSIGRTCFIMDSQVVPANLICNVLSDNLRLNFDLSLNLLVVILNFIHVIIIISLVIISSWRLARILGKVKIERVSEIICHF